VIPKNPASNQPSAEKKPGKSHVNKKLIQSEATQSNMTSTLATTECIKSSFETADNNSQGDFPKAAAPAKKSNDSSLESQNDNSTTTESAPNVSNEQQQQAKSEVDSSKKQFSSINTNLVRSKTNAATVSVANIMNSDLNTSKPNKNKGNSV